MTDSRAASGWATARRRARSIRSPSRSRWRSALDGIDAARWRRPSPIPATQPLPFSFGFHPAFAWPLPGGAAKAAHRIAFARHEPQPIRRIDAASGLLLPEAVATPVQGRTALAPDQLFEADALIWDAARQPRAQLRRATAARGCDIGLSRHADARARGRSRARAISCIEPWQRALPIRCGVSTVDFRDKPGVIERRRPAATRSFRMDVTVSPAANARAMSTPLSNRRTFAIISHPDAGKTTLTEKLLLQGGAIHLAGEVKARGQARRARSDWMKIEQQRGISVTSSVMTFERDGITFNLLDTPGHEDFSEDTYRTLTAVDSAIMVIDAAKGIEPQTRKLFEVCRLRSVPIITFVNKVDREGRSPFELLDEVADALALDVVPDELAGRHGRAVRGRARFRHAARSAVPKAPSREFLGKREDDAELPADVAEEVELAQGGYPEFDLEAYRHGDLTPVYFGSALKNFGVAELIDAIARYRPAAAAAAVERRARSSPTRDEVTGFVFKVQANMDPQHRDRIAFMRMVSGTFKRGMKLTPSGSGKPIAVHSPILFFAQDREIADTAEAGRHHRHPQPRHAAGRRYADREERGPLHRPAQLRARDPAPGACCKDPTKTKQLRKALDDLSEEGVIQVFYPGDRRAVDRRRGRPAPARGADLAARGRIQGRGRARGRRRSTPRAGSRAATRRSRASPTSTVATSPRTATATRCSWPSRRGTSATSRNATRS